MTIAAVGSAGRLVCAAGALSRGALPLPRGASGTRAARTVPPCCGPPPLLALLVASASAIGTPIFSPYHGDERLLAAFREHFAWNWGKWHGGWRAYLTGVAAGIRRRAEHRGGVPQQSRRGRAPSRPTTRSAR